MSIHAYIDDIRQRLIACHATNAMVVEASGGVFSESWVSKFRSGRMKNPRVETLSALDGALSTLECLEDMTETAQAA
jgi:hypothetical protein